MSVTLPLIEFKNVGKRFGNFWANRNIQFSIQSGTIHALVGENGAGKTTAMRLLFGLLKPDEGHIKFNGTEIFWKSPYDALHHGIGMVHQHFMLAEALPILSNIILGREPSLLGSSSPFLPISWSQAKKRVQELYEKLGFSQSLNSPISSLSIGDQQRVEILKLLYQNAHILIFDEPTAVFSPPEVKLFLQQLETLKKQGKTIILISHKLNEVLQVADEITVLRQGTVVESFHKGRVNKEELASKIIGNVVKSESFSNRSPVGEKLLETSSVTLNAGEILGIAGVEGNGQEELIEHLLKEARQKKIKPIGYVPAHRHTHAMIPEETLVKNFAMNSISPLSGKKEFFLNWKNLTAQTKQCCDQVQLSSRNPETKVQELSGGNQQKFIVARELFKQPKCLVVSQPTRGVDIAASQNLRKMIFAARQNGSAVLLISSDLEELFTLSDRIQVIYNRKIVSTLSREHFSEEVIGNQMIGLQSP